MAATLMRQDLSMGPDSFVSQSEPCAVEELFNKERDEVLDFLSARPVHTVFMAGLIHDNGIVSPHNRGSFYGYRNGLGELEGVALVGNATIVETQSEMAVLAFAKLARNCQARLIRGERESVERFWDHYSRTGVQPRLVCRELLLHSSEPLHPDDPIADLKPATMTDLEKIMAVNAAMALQEGGISPLQRDPSGFRQRTARRIEQGRVWVWNDDSRLIFKADIVAQTPQVIYLEGVHVHEDERRKGYGSRCLAQLSADLLKHTDSICLTINETNKPAKSFYEKAGYRLHNDYQTIYLR